MRCLLIALTCGAWAVPGFGADLRFVQDMSTSPPFIEFVRGPEGRVTVTGGLLVELSRQLAAELGREATFMPMPRKRLEPALQAGDADLLCYIDPAWLSEPERLDWTGVFLRNENVLVARTGQSLPSQLEDLRQARIGTVAGYIYPEFQGRLGQDGLQRDDAPNDATNLRKLVAGRVDYVVTHRLYLDHMLRVRPELREAIGGRLEIRRFEARCAVSRRASVSAAELDAAIERLQRSGRWAAIVAAYR